MASHGEGKGEWETVKRRWKKGKQKKALTGGPFRLGSYSVIQYN